MPHVPTTPNLIVRFDIFPESNMGASEGDGHRYHVQIERPLAEVNLVYDESQSRCFISFISGRNDVPHMHSCPVLANLMVTRAELERAHEGSKANGVIDLTAQATHNPRGLRWIENMVGGAGYPPEEDRGPKPKIGVLLVSAEEAFGPNDASARAGAQRRVEQKPGVISLKK